jgi:nucleoside-diphosphate-sugar epimerase
MGSRLIPLLLDRGHEVTAVIRDSSRSRLPAGANTVVADPLQEGSYASRIGSADTFVHLIGTPHPSPAKAKEFREIDLVSIQVAVKAAREAGVKHFIYLSVAHPAPMMHAFIAVRSRGEEMIRASGMNATFLRPWYVLGPGHRWAYALLPFYWICERLPSTRDSAQRLGLITLSQMLSALIYSVENPPVGIRILDIPEMRKLAVFNYSSR